MLRLLAGLPRMAGANHVFLSATQPGQRISAGTRLKAALDWRMLRALMAADRPGELDFVGVGHRSQRPRPISSARQNKRTLLYGGIVACQRAMSCNRCTQPVLL